MARSLHVRLDEVRDEVRRLAADEHDREEMRLVREQLAEPPRRLRAEMVRGEIFRLPAPQGARGHEQRGAPHAIVVQGDEFHDLSTVLASPTSTSVRPGELPAGDRTRPTRDTCPRRADDSRRPRTTRPASRTA